MTEYLKDWTTMRVGGPAREFLWGRTNAEIVEAVTRADEAGTPVLILGGGSNLVVGDDGFDGLVVLMATQGITEETRTACGGAYLRVAAGEQLDRLVATCVDNGWRGLECLSGIPGTVGAAPLNNVGAYGAECGPFIDKVLAWDRRERTLRELSRRECEFAYRDSMFKRDPARWVILDVWFELGLGHHSLPLTYAELCTRLGVERGQAAPLADVRREVRALRASKGMLLDDADHDTWSSGSFFVNPIVPAHFPLPDDAPRYPVAGRDDVVKTSAAWLIDHAGFHKGHGDGPARLSTKHTLAITNRGAATAAHVLALRDEIVAGVREAYGITLVPEPVIVA